MPATVITAMGIVIAGAGYSFWFAIARFRNGGIPYFSAFLVAVAVAIAYGLYRGTAHGWMGARFYLRTLSVVLGGLAICGIVIGIVFAAVLFGADRQVLRPLIAWAALLGPWVVLPVLSELGYRLLGKPTALAYCRICPFCIARFKIPMHLLTRSYGCEYCKPGNPQSTFD